MNGARRRSAAFLLITSVVALLITSGLTALGLWQVQRLAWKKELIATIDSRIHASPIPTPNTATDADVYRRVEARGQFLHDKAVLVQAVTVRGPGFWVLTPLRTDRGFTVLINRGFVPPERKEDYARPIGDTTIVGLLRISEPKGGFLRTNDAAGSKWYSRDVPAIAEQEKLNGPVAPYFIDAQGDQSGYPVPGLTVVSFPNNHLVYALTWFALAIMTIGAYAILMKQHRKQTRA